MVTFAANAILPSEWARASGVLPRAVFPDPLLGTEVGGVLLQRVIAKGGVGMVYAGIDRASGEAAAVKVVRTRHADDVGIFSRFIRETCFALRVRHPNVFEVHARGTLADGRPFYVMPLYDGETLGDIVRQGGQLALERALDIGDELLAALEALHAARVVHRDLQPGNVLIAPRPGQRDAVRVLDLGFAAEPGVDDGDGVTLDSPGSLVGTLGFMSPEQATRSRAITPRSDLFGAALLVYYALTSKLAFRSDGELEVIVSIVRAAPTPIRRYRRDVPAAVEAVLVRALAKHPDARFASATEMREALVAAR
jgi:serine/threonine protein kinase